MTKRRLSGGRVVLDGMPFSLHSIDITTELVPGFTRSGPEAFTHYTSEAISNRIRMRVGIMEEEYYNLLKYSYVSADHPLFSPQGQAEIRIELGDGYGTFQTLEVRKDRDHARMEIIFEMEGYVNWKWQPTTWTDNTSSSWNQKYYQAVDYRTSGTTSSVTLNGDLYMDGKPVTAKPRKKKVTDLEWLEDRVKQTRELAKVA